MPYAIIILIPAMIVMGLSVLLYGGLYLLANPFVAFILEVVAVILIIRYFKKRKNGKEVKKGRAKRG